MTVKTFISRPLLSLVISVFIVLLGVISLLSLPLEEAINGLSVKLFTTTLVFMVIFIQLKPWKERRGKAHSSSAVMEKIGAILSHETEAQSFVSEPGMVEGYGGNGGFEFSVQSRKPNIRQSDLHLPDMHRVRLSRDGSPL